jgi:predicted GH43/DUF377 family glycosyl hydrolase
VAQTHYYLYFAGYDGLTEQVGVARSTDQQHWEVTPQPAIPIGNAGDWDCIQTSNPCVLREGGRFRMWYQGVDERRCYRIGYAESQDGWQWHKVPGVLFERPGLADLEQVPRREGYHQPLVFREGERYRMYFLDHRKGLGYIRTAESADGLTWEVWPEDCLAPERPWEDKGLHYPWVIQEAAGYTLWYTSRSQQHGHWALNRAVSSDGRHWQRQPDAPIISVSQTRPHSRYPWLLPRKLLRFYPHYLHPHTRNRARAIQLPTGPLGRWLVAFHDQVIYPLRAERYVSFNNSSVVPQADGGYLMYFQAVTENTDLAIGSATSRDGITWGDFRMNLLRPTIVAQEIAWCSVFDADPHLLVWQE